MIKEIEVAKEAWGIIKTRPDQFKTIAGLYLLSIAGKEKGYVTRTSVIPMRNIDDWLDGDLKIENPLDQALDLRRQIETGEFNEEDPNAMMLRSSLEILERKALPNDNPRQDFLDLTDAMIFDYERQEERRVLTTEELEDYFLGTFNTWVNIMLLGLDSKFRSNDIPALSYSQGWIYSMRDLPIDWERGVVNIPQEILTEARLKPDCSLEELLGNERVLHWFNQSLSLLKPELLLLRKQLKRCGEPVTYLVCNKFISSMLKFEVTDISKSR